MKTTDIDSVARLIGRRAQLQNYIEWLNEPPAPEKGKAFAISMVAVLPTKVSASVRPPIIRHNSTDIIMTVGVKTALSISAETELAEVNRQLVSYGVELVDETEGRELATD